MITCNNRKYKLLDKIIVVGCIDGTSPEYIDNAIKKNLMPNWEKGNRYIVDSAFPTMTNPNNVSIITGVNPIIHGIEGNTTFKKGKEKLNKKSKLIKCPTILEMLNKENKHILIITAKSKLYNLLSKGLNPETSLVISVEHLYNDQEIKSQENLSKSYKSLIKFDLLNILRKIEIPNIYDPQASITCFEIGLEILKNSSNKFHPSIIYLSTTDFVQHKYPPDHEISNKFYKQIDEQIGKYLKLNTIVGMTADHGMNTKNNIIFLEEKLNEIDVKCFVNRTIKDPYNKHHGALGSFATVYLKRQICKDKNKLLKIIKYLNSMKGVNARWNNRQNCIFVDGDKETAFGSKKKDHDLTDITELRTHGGTAEMQVPMYLSIKPSKEVLYNFDIFHALLNV